MRKRAVGSYVDGFRTLFEVGTLTGLSDGQLLERYLRRGDDSAEAAFRALVDRHGPMVLRACRGVLRDPHAAEDAFQATFLILARKGGSIQKRDSVASWLFGVARRVAIRSDARRRRRSVRERQGVAMDEAIDRSREFPESLGEIQAEVDRLPERFRAPIVLCYLEGLTQDEAAARLRLPASTVRVRLFRARARLRDRLERRGFSPGSLAVIAVRRADAMIPAPLVDETVRAAIRLAAGQAAGLSAPVAALAEGMIRVMFLAKLKFAAVLLAALSCASAWMIATAAGPPSKPTDPAQPPVEAKKAGPQPKGPEVAVEVARRSKWKRTTSQPTTLQAFDSVDVYARVSGYVNELKVDIGSAVKEGEVLAEIHSPEVFASVAKAKAEVDRAFAHLAKVKAALEVARAAAELEHSKVEAADAAWKSAVAARDYRDKQFHRMSNLSAQHAIGQSFVDNAKDKYESAIADVFTAEAQRKIARGAEVEARAKVLAAEADTAESEADLKIAEAGLKSAEIAQEGTKIQSPYKGIVVFRHEGLHKGAYVRSADLGNSAPLLTIVRPDLMRAVIAVPTHVTTYVDVGDPVKIRIDALGPNTVLKGVISRTAYAMEKINDRTRALRVEVDLPNRGNRLRPGQSGFAEIQLESRENVLSIPIAAIEAAGVVLNQLESGDTTRCLCIRDGRAVAVPIRIGEFYEGRVEVLEGLKEGESVVIEVDEKIEDGTPVRLRPKRDQHGLQ